MDEDEYGETGPVLLVKVTGDSAGALEALAVDAAREFFGLDAVIAADRRYEARETTDGIAGRYMATISVFEVK